MMETLAHNYAAFFEQLTPNHTHKDYSEFFDDRSSFSDPFQSVQGTDAIVKVFADMYETLYEPRFVVKEIIENRLVAYMQWSFEYKRTPRSASDSFVGVSRVEFSPSGRVKSHVDYWDAAHNIYEKIPLLGSIIKIIKRKIVA
jgi:hypothetical protein